MRYRLLVTDVDGTLLPADRRLPPEVCEAVRAAQARGVRVGLATGRMWKSVWPYLEAVGADSPVILYKGAVVYDFHAGRVLERHRLDSEAVRAALEVVREFGDVRPHLFADDRVYVDRQDEQSRAYLERDGITAEEVGDLLAHLPPDPVKVLVVGEPARLAELERELSHRAPGVRRVFSERNFPFYIGIRRQIGRPVQDINLRYPDRDPSEWTYGGLYTVVKASQVAWVRVNACVERLLRRDDEVRELKQEAESLARKANEVENRIQEELLTSDLQGRCRYV